MALKIGRAGLTLALPEPMSWNSSGGSVTVSGTVGPISPVTDALRLRDQLLGYVDNWDEPVVPVIVDGDPRLTGYYRVLSVQVPTDPVATGLGIFTYSVQLQPVQGFAQPWLEAIVSGALLTNVVGAVVADTDGFHAVPAVASEYQAPNPATTYQTRVSADGTLTFSQFAGATGLSGTGRCGLTPANFYIGAATVEQGSSLQPIVGRILTQPDVVNWRLSNGLVRVTPNATPAWLDISHYNGTTWSTAKTYELVPNFNGWNSLTVLRNSVEEVVIRLSLKGLVVGVFTLDLALRRGDRLVRCYFTASSSQAFGIKRHTTEAATAITYGAVTLGGMRATANDGDGNRYVLLSYQSATTNDLVNGGITQNSTSLTADFAIGSEIGGSGAAAPQDAVSLAKQYLAAQSESQRVVSR